MLLRLIVLYTVQIFLDTKKIRLQLFRNQFDIITQTHLIKMHSKTIHG